MAYILQVEVITYYHTESNPSNMAYILQVEEHNCNGADRDNAVNPSNRAASSM